MQRADPIKRGDDAKITCTVVDGSGAAIDISGYKVFFALKTDPTNDRDDSTAVLTKTQILGTTTDTGNGIATITLTDSDTDIKPDDYLAEVQLIDGSALVTSFETFIQPVVADINRRTS